MDEWNSTYPDSYTEINENNDFHSLASNEIDFVDHWVNLTVEKEVMRGSQLREEKLRSYPELEGCEVVSIDLVRQPASGVDIDMCYNRKRSPGRSKVRNRSCSPKSRSPHIKIHSFPQAYTPQKVYSRPHTPSVKARVLRCPMRIAELAVPTKRQCIDTWRNKCDVLPPFMMERLRQQIMDEKPVVQIKEAISCFKRRKPKSVQSMKRCNQSARDFKMKIERMVDIRNFCAAFANKMAQRLNTPQDIKLTPQLESVSCIIFDEISKIIQNRKKYNIDIGNNNKIQAEMAGKIAIWIAMILQDASYKILEEDLRVKKNFDSKNDIDEGCIIANGKSLHHKYASELEEEEGPILDFLDDVVDNVVTLCEPPEVDIVPFDDISDATSKGEHDKSVATPESIENNEFDTSTLYTNITYGTGEDTINKSNQLEQLNLSEIDNQLFDQTIEVSIDDHIRGELDKIVTSVVGIDHNYSIGGNDSSNDKDIDDEVDNDSPMELVDLLPEAPGNSDLSQLKKDYSGSEVIENVVLSPKKSIHDGIDDLMTEVADMVLSPQNSTKDGIDVAESLDKDLILSPTNSPAHGKEDSKFEVQDVEPSPKNSSVVGLGESHAVEEDVVLSPKKSNHDGIDDLMTAVADVVLSPGNSSKDGIDVSESLDKDVILSPINSSADGKEDSKFEVQDVVSSPKNSSEDGLGESHYTEEDVVLSSKTISQDGFDDKSNLENDNAENHNVSDKFDEDILDDKNKKVKFSEVKMDLGAQDRKVDINSALNWRGENEKERGSWHSSTDLNNMVFAPPNDHLLSDADELWPENLTPPVVKASTSVSRSVTSLGKILETDEKFLLPEDEIRSSLDWETTNQTELEITDHTSDVRRDQLDNIQISNEDQITEKDKDELKPDLTHEKNSEDMMKDKTLSDKTRDIYNLIEDHSDNIQNSNKEEVQIAEIDKDEKTDLMHKKNSADIITDETESSIDTIKRKEDKAMIDKIIGVNVVQELNTKLLILDSSTSPMKITGNEAATDVFEKLEKDADMNLKSLESDTNVIFEAVQQKMKSSYVIPEPKHNYKVHPKTAPSWLRHDHGKGEPSEDSFRGGKCKEKVKETEIRNWCKDLERCLLNLEMWNGWIDNTCKNVLYLKQKREMNKLFSPNAKRKDAKKDWITLKKNIDKDAVLWTKLNQKAHERLKTYKEKTKERHQQQEPEENAIFNLNDDNKTVLKSLQEIDRMCLLMHRMIVSTEYCMLCDCKNAKRKL